MAFEGLSKIIHGAPSTRATLLCALHESADDLEVSGRLVGAGHRVEGRAVDDCRREGPQLLGVRRVPVARAQQRLLPISRVRTRGLPSVHVHGAIESGEDELALGALQREERLVSDGRGREDALEDRRMARLEAQQRLHRGRPDHACDRLCGGREHSVDLAEPHAQRPQPVRCTVEEGADCVRALPAARSVTVAPRSACRLPRLRTHSEDVAYVATRQGVGHSEHRWPEGHILCDHQSGRGGAGYLACGSKGGRCRSWGPIK
mmetsp:Transcript_54969/g.153279  ORF Transcript_54969/g.153279 Transcript_54969/m.153279 type:complete len:262 (-) Transcript_54969:282-1067(-)